MTGKYALAALAAGIVIVAPGPAAAEPADADPLYIADAAPNAPSPATLSRFTVAGAALAVQARGRYASIDTWDDAVALERAIEMSKAMPGHPQPAYVTFDLKVYF